MNDLTTQEKVLILKAVSIFAQTPDEILADEVVAILEEVELPTGDTIFHKGDVGDCMYIIGAGLVRVHDGDMTLNHLGRGAIFGEMAVLDPEPRLATVTAVEDTLLFRLDQEPLYKLMSSRVEVVQAVVRVLIRYVRARVRDLAEEFEYIKQVSRLTAAAASVEAGIFDPESIEEVTQREDELGQLARVFQRMVREVKAREESLKKEIMELRIEIDESRRAQDVSQITGTDYFRDLQAKARAMRDRMEEADNDES